MSDVRVVSTYSSTLEMKVSIAHALVPARIAYKAYAGVPRKSSFTTPNCTRSRPSICVSGILE